MRNVILLSIMFGMSANLRAQNVTTHTIRWQIGNAQEVNAGKVSQDLDQVISYGTTKIEWQDATGVVKKTFTINETNGSWSNLQTNGSILYEVNSGEQQGTITIFRSATEFIIRITLLKGDEDPDLYELSIIDFEIL